jgi:preprotein translocase subunit SecG
MRRALAVLLLVAAIVLLAAPAALGFDGGQGTYGETNDKIVTNAGFILIAFFPLFILVMSLIQWSLDRRKQRRKAAHKALAREEHVWRGGW